MLSMTWDLPIAGVLFVLLAGGLAWPLAASLPLTFTEKLTASVTLSLTFFWLSAWIVYLTGLPWPTLWTLPLLAIAALWSGRRALVELLGDPVARECLLAQAIISLWCLGWLATVATYSGGGWAGDWGEHWERARFYLQREPHDRLFIGLYSLTARPPLANVLNAGWLALTRADFAHYQIFSTLLASLAFLPTAALARRLGGNRCTVALLAVLFMLNPLFVQNTTFPWTKLPAALFVLATLVFFLAHRDRRTASAPALLFALALAAGLLTHYSVAPYALVLAVTWIFPLWRWRELSFIRVTIMAAGAGMLLLATWFAWAVARYGAANTFLSNTSITDVSPSISEQAARVLLNLRDTLVPFCFRNPPVVFLAQESPWGWIRDWCFLNYQLNLFFAMGSVGGALTLLITVRAWPKFLSSVRWPWAMGIIGILLLGIGVHSARDVCGLTHICLQPLVLLALCWLALRWPLLSTTWQRILIMGLTIDALAGITLHFAVQSHALDRWLMPDYSFANAINSHNITAVINALFLRDHGLTPWSRYLDFPFILALALLGALLIIALIRFRHQTR